MNKLLTLFALLAISIAPAGASSLRGNVTQTDRNLWPSLGGQKTIYDLAKSTPQLDTLVSLMDACGRGDFFQNLLDDPKQTLTVFAPRNSAFTILGRQEPDVVEDWVNAGEVCNVLQYHVVAGKEIIYNTRRATANRSYRTVAPGKSVTARTAVTRRGRKIYWVNDFARVSNVNLQASNGVVHIIKQVLRY